MLEKIHTDTTPESSRTNATQAVRPSTEQPLQRKRDIAENKKKEREQAEYEKKLDGDLETTFKNISSSLKNKIGAAKKDIELIRADSTKQWFWERMGSNSESQISEFQAMADAASALLSRLEEGYAQAQLSTFPEKKAAFLQMLKDFTKVDDSGVPLMDSEGQFVSELLRNKPNFAKLQSEYDSMEQKLNLAEQGLQYSQTVLETAASYAGPPGTAAALIPKYIIQLSTGQSTPTNIALQVFEDVVSSYIGSGKVAKAVLQKLGPYAGKLIQAFQSSEKSGWTKNAIKSAIVQCIDIFRDKELQNVFAWGKEQITGEEAQYMSYTEVAGGQILGKVAKKGLDRSGIGGALSNAANGVTNSPTTNASGGTADVMKDPSSGEELVFITDKLNPFSQSMRGNMETARQRNMGNDSSQKEESSFVETSSPTPEEFKSRRTQSGSQPKEKGKPSTSKNESETPFYSRQMNPFTQTAQASLRNLSKPQDTDDTSPQPPK